MSLSTYMDLCLSHPKYGYYMTRDPFGEKGDFTTAPEISQMFGELIGVWLADLWEQAGSPEKCILLECGPGRGTLMADILRSTQKVEGFHDSIDIRFIETSPVLAGIQKQTLSGYEVTWHTTLEELGEIDYPVFVVANEFYDALPVKQFERVSEGWAERCVGLNDNQLSLGLSQPSQYPDMPAALSNGQTVEVGLVRQQVFEDLCGIIEANGGVQLIIDYGYRTGHGDTLQAVHKHRKVPILEKPGECDLTAHVDFQKLIETALDKDMQVSPLQFQGQFLRSLGIELRAAMLKKKATAEQREDIDMAVKRLCDETEMGQLFKVLCVYSRVDGKELQPVGF